jgi:hypothetical protein
LLDTIDRVLTFLFIDVRDRPTHRRARPESPNQKAQQSKTQSGARRLSFGGLASIATGVVAAGTWLALLVPVGLVVIAIAWLKGDRLGLLAVGVVYFAWYVSTVVWVMLKAG